MKTSFNFGRRIGLVSLGLAISVVLGGAGSGAAPAAEEGVLVAVSDDDGAIRTVPRASCGEEDNPETALQGQVPAALRASGFKGFNCNLKLVAQSRGEGASWQHAFFTDRDERRCSYYDTLSPVNGTANRIHLGTVVVDTTDPRRPAETGYLTTTSMLDPWESLKVHTGRQLLLGENGTNAAGGPELDVYDVARDCRYPQLLSSVATGTVANGDASALPAGEILKGHEGNVSPDGLTWYSGDRGTPKKIHGNRHQRYETPTADYDVDTASNLPCDLVRDHTWPRAERGRQSRLRVARGDTECDNREQHAGSRGRPTHSRCQPGSGAHAQSADHRGRSSVLAGRCAESDVHPDQDQG